MRIGLLTGGGDCPGLNAAIRAVVRTAETTFGDTIVAFHHGWRGVAEGDAFALTSPMTRRVIGLGGTILGTARFHPDEHEGALDAVAATAKSERLDAVIAIGGDGTLSASVAVAELGVPIVGIPKTIDNDVVGTDSCIGFDTALSTATEAVDRVHTTAESHDRTIVLELMGRSTGWLAAGAGLAAGAEVILIPERPLPFDRVVESLQARHRSGRSYSIVVVAEGVQLADGKLAASGQTAPALGSIGPTLSTALAEATGYETRCTVLGHVQRGGPATPADRLLGTRFGAAAVDAVHRGCSANLVGATGSSLRITRLPTRSDGIRPVPTELLHLIDTLSIA